MENAHKRKKQPDVVRRALLDHAIRIAVETGLGGVTVQAVAQAAGVTKGGFLHHFPSKQSLIDAIFEGLLAELDAALARAMRADTTPHGAFTRAYVTATLDMLEAGGRSQHAALSVLMLGDPRLMALWSDWYNARLEQYAATDADPRLWVVRLAVDGVWMADMSSIQLPDRAVLRKTLLDATYGAVPRA